MFSIFFFYLITEINDIFKEKQQAQWILKQRQDRNTDSTGIHSIHTFIETLLVPIPMFKNVKSISSIISSCESQVTQNLKGDTEHIKFNFPIFKKRKTTADAEPQIQFLETSWEDDLIIKGITLVSKGHFSWN